MMIRITWIEVLMQIFLYENLLAKVCEQIELNHLSRISKGKYFYKKF